MFLFNIAIVCSASIALYLNIQKSMQTDYVITVPNTLSHSHLVVYVFSRGHITWSIIVDGSSFERIFSLRSRIHEHILSILV